jgi:hypothetical protein
MITQHYKVKATKDNIENGRPGCFVFEDNDADVPKGFIDFVSDCEMAIMLFEPEELKGFEYTHIASLVDWETRLQEIIDNDSEMKEVWDQVWK